MRALEKALKFYGLSIQATPTQLSSYLMQKIESFHENATEEQAIPLKAACVVGLQPEDGEASSDSQQLASTHVWVLNDKVHLDDNGHHIHPSPYTWLGDHCSGKRTPFVAPQSLASSVKAPVMDDTGKISLSNLIDADHFMLTTTYLISYQLYLLLFV